MHEEELRTVLLVKAIEESDREGTLLPPADRIAASREARRAQADAGPDRLLVQRARMLFERLLVRHPFVREVHAFAGGPAWIGIAIVAAAVLLGAALSALDGTRRINILAFPLLGLVAWNLVVYAIVILGWFQSARKSAPHGRWLPAIAADQAFSRVATLIARSRSFNAPLAEALARFVNEWRGAARPLLLAKAGRLFHFAAAAVGIGLIAGLYLRGIAFDYRAGWESTFLDASRARELLAFMYGPASWLTGIGIPDATHLEAIRWRPGGGGETAARWMHLLAATALIFVVLPRLALAVLSSAVIARGSANMALPPTLGAYSRVAFSGVGGLVDRGIAMVVPYAYEPEATALARLRSFASKELGEHLAIDLRPPVRYGDEEPFARDIGTKGGELADVIVVLVSLASTPEDENHGKLIEGLRDWMARERPRAQLLVLADEGPYAARMGGPGGSPARLEERRDAWRAFVKARGVESRFVDLRP